MSTVWYNRHSSVGLWIVMAEKTFDLFAGLDALTKGDMRWYDALPDDAKKQAAPFVIMRWLCGTGDAAQLVRINTFVNPYAFALGAEKPLLFKLLAATTTHKPKRYYWLKAPGAVTKKLSLEVIKEYYGISGREAATYQLDKETLLEMAEELGWDDEELKKLKKEVQ